MSASKLKRGLLESTIEDYFVEQVEAAGGAAPKLKDTGRKGFPDRTAIWPAYGWARVHFIELKTIGGALEPWQKRYHADLRRLGCTVLTLWTKKQIDDYVREYQVPF